MFTFEAVFIFGRLFAPRKIFSAAGGTLLEEEEEEGEFGLERARCAGGGVFLLHSPKKWTKDSEFELVNGVLGGRDGCLVV